MIQNNTQVKLEYVVRGKYIYRRKSDGAIFSLLNWDKDGLRLIKFNSDAEEDRIKVPLSDMADFEKMCCTKCSRFLDCIIWKAGYTCHRFEL